MGLFELLNISGGQRKNMCLLNCQLSVKLSIGTNETSLLLGCNYCQLFENMHMNMSTFCIFYLLDSYFTYLNFDLR